MSSVPGIITQSGVIVPTINQSRITKSPKVPNIIIPKVFRKASSREIVPPSTLSNINVEIMGKPNTRMIKGMAVRDAVRRSESVCGGTLSVISGG
jgi:hypothetical protein